MYIYNKSGDTQMDTIKNLIAKYFAALGEGSIAACSDGYILIERQINEAK
jgi:hypothetical protein